MSPGEGSAEPEWHREEKGLRLGVIWGWGGWELNSVVARRNEGENPRGSYIYECHFSPHVNGSGGFAGSDLKYSYSLVNIR